MENPSQRDIFEVITKILEIIPKEQEKLIKSLNKYIDKLLFMPPEHMRSFYCWSALAEILNNSISDVKEDWQIKIRDVVNNKI